ncbi:TetR/AcrR family transcriptional regulator [Corynebacterium sp. H78]|uniref:TetR/AcrR family transcriptional regulator n=1 Tax=Corynebacterium sp. H78 TaxID=3133417 RepID=UPI00309E9DAC
MTLDSTPTRRRNSAATRARIIDTATTYFTQKPFARVSLKEIATEAGVSAPLIIKYFGSKEGLLAELIDFGAITNAIAEQPFNELGRLLATDAISGEHLGPSSVVSLLMATSGSDNVTAEIEERFKSTARSTLLTRVRNEAPGITDEAHAERRCDFALAMYMGMTALLLGNTTNQSCVTDVAITSYGEQIQRVLENA